MFIIKIIESENKELINSIWETDGIKSKCIDPGKSKYIPGFVVNSEDLGNYKSILLDSLND